MSYHLSTTPDDVFRVPTAGELPEPEAASSSGMPGSGVGQARPMAGPERASFRDPFRPSSPSAASFGEPFQRPSLAPWQFPDGVQSLATGGLVDFLRQGQTSTAASPEPPGRPAGAGIRSLEDGGFSLLNQSRLSSPGSFGAIEEDAFARAASALDRSLDFSSSVQGVMASVEPADMSHIQEISPESLTSKPARQATVAARFSPSFLG